jgi:hypothetical protein
VNTRSLGGIPGPHSLPGFKVREGLDDPRALGRQVFGGIQAGLRGHRGPEGLIRGLEGFSGSDVREELEDPRDVTLEALGSVQVRPQVLVGINSLRGRGLHDLDGVKGLRGEYQIPWGHYRRLAT